ncbi:MAG TPA: hypothetical protein VGR57_01945, partial [Ktedonobacterales bacterium]|nr:hypothetical protein [Ktedonobacterales bacterium]
PENELTWVAETIFTRLLYLVTVIVVIGSDFVFAILRLQAELFPTLPVPKQDLSNLSLLIGALLVSIVLLTGALTLDFMEVLPEQVRLFPKLDRGKRRLLLGISVLSFVMSLVVVGLLFLQGQLLISLGQTFNLGTLLLATLLGILQVLVVFLGAWGAVRGLAILLALLGGVIGLTLHVVAVALRWIGDAIDLIGTVVLRNLILALAALFGRRANEPVSAPSKDSALAIVGYGDRSSSFTALLCEEVAQMYSRSGLLAAGTYSSEPAVQDAAHARLVRVGMNDISPLSAHDVEPLNTLKTHVQAIYQRKKALNKLLLWVVDGERAASSLGMLGILKREVPDLTITILCLLPPEGIRKSDPRDQINRLFGQRPGDHPITTTIMVDDRSPLYTRWGEPVADRLVARTLSGMLLAPQHNPGNPSFLSVMRGLTEEDHTFAALAVDTAGIDTTGGTSEVATSGGVAAHQPKDSGSVSSEVAAERTERSAGNLLSGSPATTVDILPDKDHDGVYVNFIVPISARTQDFITYRGRISKWLADEQDLYLYGVVEGSGVALPDSTAQHDRYAQVGVLYPYDISGGGTRVAQLSTPGERES